MDTTTKASLPETTKKGDSGVTTKASVGTTDSGCNSSTTTDYGGITDNPVTTDHGGEITGSPAGTTGNPGGTTGNPGEITGSPAGTTDNPCGTTGSPAGTTDNPCGTTGSPAGTTDNPCGTTGSPAGTTDNPCGTTGSPAGTTGNPGASTDLQSTCSGLTTVQWNYFYEGICFAAHGGPIDSTMTYFEAKNACNDIPGIVGHLAVFPADFSTLFPFMLYVFVSRIDSILCTFISVSR